MGVFTVGRQVALEIPMPGWWLANAAVDMDFRRGLYYDSSTANPRAATDFLSCVRASTGYAKTADGTLTQFASNALRIGVGTGLLVEDARTNILLQSSDFGTTWGTDGANITVNQAVAPDGTTTMDKADDGAANQRHLVYQLSATITANTNYTFSIFIKDVDRRYVQLSLTGFAGGGAIYCFADLQTGTITDSGVALAATGTVFTAATIESYASGIYRISITGIPNNTTTANYCQVCLSDRSTLTGSLDNFTTPIYAGTSKSIYLWGGQYELGSFPSSYIPTTTAAATRAADAVACSGNLSTILTSLPHTAVVDVIANASPAISGGFIALLGSNNDTSWFANNNDTQIRFHDVSNYSSVAPTLGNSLTWSGGVKAGLAQQSGALSMVGGGGTVGTDTIAGAFSGARLGVSAATGAYWMGYFRRLTVWNSKLADATLQALTAP